MNFSIVMVSYGDGFCDEGYYAGWDGKGIESQEKCNDLCLDEPECTYASFFPIKDGKNGNTCSRYNGQSCNLFCEKPGIFLNTRLGPPPKIVEKIMHRLKMKRGAITKRRINDFGVGKMSRNHIIKIAL